MKIFEIKPHRGGWQCYEAPGVQPYWTGAGAKQSAIDYAMGRTAQSNGEIRVFNDAGEIEEVIAFNERSLRH
jgi:hypothetical protein